MSAIVANGRKEVVLRCNPDAAGNGREWRGVVEYETFYLGDDPSPTMIPVAIHMRCKNRECCERREGFNAFHRFPIFRDEPECPVGRFTTSYLPQRPISDFIEAKLS